MVQGVSDLVSMGLFKITFLFILALRAKMKKKIIIKKLRFVLFGANLAQFEDKSDIPDR